MANKLTVANLVMLVGAAVTLLFSFFDMYTSGGQGVNAWDTDLAAFVSTIPAILAIAMIVVIVLELAGVNLPDEVLTFNWAQIKATWGIAAVGIMVAFLTVDLGTGVDRGIGYWLMLLGSAAMTAGAVMSLLGKGNEPVSAGTATSASATEPTTGMTPPPPPPPPPAP